MDNQTPSSGHENHGVHVCHTCGWPFPNPHPSAKHRRSHKRVCGTIEGFKLDGVDLEGSSHSNVSDDEPNNPNVKVLEASGNNKGKSEDEVFSDAVSEILDGGVGAGTQEVLAINETKVLIHSNANDIQSIDCGSSEFLGPTSSSVVSSVSDSQTKDSILLLDSHGNASSEDFKPMKSETQKISVDAGSDSSSTLAKQGTDPEEKNETRSDINPPGVKILPSQAEIEPAEFTNPGDLAEKTEVVDANVHVLSVSDDIHETDNAKIMLEDFKDHKVSSNQSATSEYELAKERDENEDRLVDDGAQSNPSEGTAISASGSYGLSQIEAQLNENDGSDVIVLHVDRAVLVSCCPGKESNDVFDENLKGNFSDGAKNVVSGVDSGSALATNSNISTDHIGQGVNEADFSDTRLTEPEFSFGSSSILVNAEKVEKTEDARDEVSNYVKSESGIDYNDVQLNGSALVTPESPKKLSQLESDRETNLQSIRACEKSAFEKHNTTSDSWDATSCHVKDAIKVNDVDSSKQESFSENAVVTESGSVEHGTETQKDLPERACTDSRSVGVDTVSDTKVVVPENDLIEHDKVQEVTDLSVFDSNSRTDSLENNWGSVSVLSVQSDAQAVIDPTESQALKGETPDSNQSKLSQEDESFDRSDIFEPPSFMTLVEPRGDAKTQTSQNQQEPSSSALQAGWFPSITNVVNESQGRKKNEELIAKVTNWSAAGKQHVAPLKSLLGEALSQDAAKPKSPKIRKEMSQTPTVNSILAPESPLAQTGREWNSPARYPAEIKREKRKLKSRPYWAQFMCCSSVH